MAGRILLVGKRKPAIAAARRLGYEPVVQQVARRALQAVHAYGGLPEGARRRARETFGDDVPAAVIAVAEGAVPSAAGIRAQYGLAGLSVAAAARCHDKLVMKRAAAAAGVPCASWLEVVEGTTSEEVVDRLGLPVVLKVPVSSGGRGVRVVRDAVALGAALAPGLLAEKWIEGIEMSVESLIADGRVLFRNRTQYLVPRWANVVPARLDAPTGAVVDALVDSVHDALGLDHGISHLELFLTDDGPVFSEVAARPPGGLLMELIELAYGFDPWEALLRVALGGRPALPARAARHAGVWLLHPGAGQVTAVEGMDEARAMSGVTRVRLAAEVGAVVDERLGSGQSVGEIVAVADAHGECARRLQAARDAVRIEVTPAS